jgi:hypothetical protein
MCKCGNIISCQGDCGCKFEVNTGCIRYTGDNLDSLGVVEGDTLEVILEELNTRFSITENASYLDVEHEYPGSNCEFGGVKIMLKDRVTNDVITTQYLCTPNLSSITGVTILDVTHTGLISLIESNGLVKGQQYRITDFQTIWDLPDYSDADTLQGTIQTMYAPVDPIVVIATSLSTISTIASQPSHPGDIIYYNPYYELPFNTSTLTKGVITYRKDTLQNNECNWDFRTIKFKRYSDSDENFSSYWDNGNTSNLFYTFNSDYAHSFNNSILTDSILKSDNVVEAYIGFPNIVLNGDMNNLDIKASIQNVTLIGSFENFVVKYRLWKFYQWGSIFNSYYENVYNVQLVTQQCSGLKVSDFFNNVGIRCASVWQNEIVGWSSITTTLSQFSENYIKYFDSCSISGGTFTKNNFSTECRHASFGNNTYQNDIDQFGSTVVGNNFSRNKGSFFSDSTVGNNCVGNQFNRVVSTIIGNDFGNNPGEANTFNAPISYSIIGESSYGNIFNSPVDEVTFGSGLKHNTFNAPLNGLDLTSATHIYNNYSTQTNIATNDGPRLTYLDNFDSRVTTYITS